MILMLLIGNLIRTNNWSFCCYLRENYQLCEAATACFSKNHLYSFNWSMMERSFIFVWSFYMSYNFAGHC